MSDQVQRGKERKARRGSPAEDEDSVGVLRAREGRRYRQCRVKHGWLVLRKHG